MGRTADLGALRSRLLGSPELVTAALELELGSGDAFGGWAELVVDQVPALSGEKEAVLAWQREQAARTEQSASGSETFDERQELTAEPSAEEAPASSEKPERESGKKAKQKKEHTQRKRNGENVGEYKEEAKEYARVLSSLILWSVSPDDNSNEWLSLFDVDHFSTAYKERNEFREVLNQND
jgi:hypothetical protein